MRIGIDARELSGQVTGVGRYLQRLLCEWASTAGDHRFLLYSADGGLSVPPGLQGDVVVVGGRPGTLWEQTALAGAVRRDAPDVFFAPGYTAPLLARSPLVLTIHDVSFAAHPEWFRRREGTRRRWLARASARRARLVLTVSQFSRSEIVRHLRVPGERVRVVTHGVGLTALPSPEREPLVLYVGSIFNRRHVPVLIDAFGRLARTRQHLRLQIVGANRTWPAQDLRELADATGAGARIDLRDFVSDDELATLYARASAFVFLSEYEGFGLTPLEALAAGVPPVVLDTPVAREVYGEAAVLVARPDAGLVADALARALDEGPTRQRVMAQSAEVLARYRWERAARQTLAALEEAAAG